jgi:hypothetical protein
MGTKIVFLAEGEYGVHWGEPEMVYKNFDWSEV